MTDSDRITCPRCSGTGQVNAFRNPGGFGPVNCQSCLGMKTVDAGFPARRHRGQNIRDARVLLGLSLRQMATALAVPITQASDVEFGRSSSADLDEAEAWIREEQNKRAGELIPEPKATVTTLIPKDFEPTGRFRTNKETGKRQMEYRRKKTPKKGGRG